MAEYLREYLRAFGQASAWLAAHFPPWRWVTDLHRTLREARRAMEDQWR